MTTTIGHAYPGDLYLAHIIYSEPTVDDDWLSCVDLTTALRMMGERVHIYQIMPNGQFVLRGTHFMGEDEEFGRVDWHVNLPA